MIERAYLIDVDNVVIFACVLFLLRVSDSKSFSTAMLNAHLEVLFEVRSKCRRTGCEDCFVAPETLGGDAGNRYYHIAVLFRVEESY